MPPKLRRRRRKFQASPRAEDMEMITGRWKVGCWRKSVCGLGPSTHHGSYGINCAALAC